MLVRRAQTVDDRSPENEKPNLTPVPPRDEVAGRLHRPAEAVAILVSKQGHCLSDLLWRWEAGELDAMIPLVISNHADLASKVEAHGIPSITCRSRRKRKPGRRRRSRPSCGSTRSTSSCWPATCRSSRRISWVPRAADHQHPSLVPAGVRGRQPYHQAHARGVKIIGATAHYVTRARRRPDHQPGRRPRLPPRRRGRHGPHRPRSRAPRAGPGRALAPRRPRAGGRESYGGLRVRLQAFRRDRHQHPAEIIAPVPAMSSAGGSGTAVALKPAKRPLSSL